MVGLRPVSCPSSTNTVRQDLGRPIRFENHDEFARKSLRFTESQVISTYYVSIIGRVVMASRWTVTLGVIQQAIAKAGHRMGYAGVFEVRAKATSYVATGIKEGFVSLPSYQQGPSRMGSFTLGQESLNDRVKFL